MADASNPLPTPDGRYIVVRGRLWRTANPALTEQRRAALVSDLMTARRSIAQARKSGDAAGEKQARAAVQAAKVALGERGPVWWTDGSGDLNRHLVRNTIYADWYASHSRPASRRGRPEPRRPRCKAG